MIMITIGNHNRNHNYNRNRKRNRLVNFFYIQISTVHMYIDHHIPICSTMI